MSDATFGICIAATFAFAIGLSFALGAFDAWMEDAEEEKDKQQEEQEETKCNNP